MTNYFILCIEDMNLHLTPVVVRVKKSGAGWTSLDAAGEACDALIDLYPEHAFTVVEEKDFGVILL